MFNPSHKQGWLICTLYNPTNGDRVQINDIDHAISGIGWEEITNELASSRSQSGWDVLFRIGSTQFEGIELIEEWVTNKTPINAVVAGGKNVQWYENVPLEQFKRQTQADRRGGDQRWSAALSFAGGYNMKIYNNVNLLHQTNVAGKKITGWHDNDGDGVADGYESLTPGVINTFLNGVQDLEGQAIDEDWFDLEFSFTELIFPIANINVVLSYDTIYASNMLGYETKHQQLNFTGSSVAAIWVEFKEPNLVGRKNIERLLVGSVWKLSLKFVISAITDDYGGESNFGCKEPALRTDGSSEYIAG